MSLKESLSGRGVTKRTVEVALANTEKVFATVIMNASKNVTNAQAMKGNTSVLAEDLKVMKAILEEFNDEQEKPARGRPRIEKEASTVSDTVEG